MRQHLSWLWVNSDAQRQRQGINICLLSYCQPVIKSQGKSCISSDGSILACVGTRQTKPDKQLHGQLATLVAFDVYWTGLQTAQGPWRLLSRSARCWKWYLAGTVPPTKYSSEKNSKHPACFSPSEHITLLLCSLPWVPPTANTISTLSLPSVKTATWLS